MIWIQKELVNPVVTDYYLITISNAIKRLGYSVCISDTFDKHKFDRKDTVVVANAKYAFVLKKARIPYIFWAQGVWPEESFLTHQSRLRFIVASWIEKYALIGAKYLFFVSESMKEFYEQKYRMKFKNYYLMPASNEELHMPDDIDNIKYGLNRFCYVGSLAKWQCFEQTIMLYKQIEEQVDSASLLLLVKESDYVHEVLKKYGVKNYEIDYVPVSELTYRLKDIKFGFILRENNPINQVATPTKILTYLSNGIIPIYSKSLQGVSKILKKLHYAVRCEDFNDSAQILRLCNGSIDGNALREEFGKVYTQYYDRTQHEEKLINDESFRRSF